MFATNIVTWAAFAVPFGDAPKEYVQKLTTVENTADGQFRLATWAKKQGLKDVANGHLRAAVHLDPQFAPAQKALGRMSKSGVWETKEERQARLDREAKTNSERQEWLKRMKEAGIDAAARDLPINEAAASAIEEFSSRNEQRALDAVKAFRSSNQGAATWGLTRQALASPFVKVREASVEALKERNPDHYLPTLVESVRPLQAGKSFVLGVGEVWHWQEGTTLHLSVPTSSVQTAGNAQAGSGAGGLDDRIGERQANAETLRTNAVAALQTVTGKKIGGDFNAWRKELMEMTDSFVDSTRPKATNARTSAYQADEMSVGTQIVASFTVGRAAQAAHECFAAGTLVAAKRGETPIDKICVGELVLSRNVETGETAYKPVLARTLRPRTEMRKLTVGSETILATPAHSFWTEGSGWTKVKNLGDRATLGGESRTGVALLKTEPAEPAQAYNLVVADWNTFFVGASRVLVHDNTPIRDAALVKQVETAGK